MTAHREKPTEIDVKISVRGPRAVGVLARLTRGLRRAMEDAARPLPAALPRPDPDKSPERDRPEGVA